LKKLGKYEVLGELGHGAMGVVYRARDPIINRLVALKTITTGVADDPAMLQRFYREAQSAGGLQHPNIVTIYDMGEAGELPYIAMELVEGENLEQVIARGSALPISLKLVYAMQACRAFDYAHKRGIVHRDIKPGNIMVNKDGTVKVVDFGIARVLEASRTQTGMLIGTFAYMSPEQYHGEHADERSDIWSFGVLFYELLTYKKPFSSPTPASLMHNICDEDPVPLGQVLPECPKELELAVHKMLRKSPGERYQSMEDVLLDLDPICKTLQSQSVAELLQQTRRLFEEERFAEGRDLVRQALQLESGNQQARALLEKANVELRRILNRPKAQQFVDKGQTLLGEGKLQEARVAAENALQLDSNFGPAEELQRAIQKEAERARLLAEWLETAKQHLAEGQPDEAETVLAKLLEAEPSHAQALTLRQQALKEKAERERARRLLEGLRQARELWTRQNYEESLTLLQDLEKEFPGNEQVIRMFDAVREDQLEQQKRQTLLQARNLLAASRHEDAIAMLSSLQKQFPNEEEIPALLEDVRRDQMNQRRLGALAEARSLLAAGQYEACLALLPPLQKTFPDEPEIPRLLETARQGQTEQIRQRSITEAGRLLAAREYKECLAFLVNLEKQFPGDEQIRNLQKAVREEQAEQEKQQKLEEARSLLTGRRFDECCVVLGGLEKRFPGDAEVGRLQNALREEQTKHRRLQGLEQAGNLLASKNYEKCLTLLDSLRKEFPDDEETKRLLESAGKEQVEQRKQDALAQARDLLARRQYDESIAFLSKLQGDFPDESAIGKMLESARKEQTERRKQESLAQARDLLARRQYDESIAFLTKLQGDFPDEGAIGKLLESARKEQTEQRLREGLAQARGLLAARHYDECIALLTTLQTEFTGETAIVKLLDSARKERADQRKQAALTQARSLLGARRYDECIALLTKLQSEFPGESAVGKLLDSARKEQADQRKQAALAQARSLLGARRYEECVALLSKLQGEFSGDSEIAKLLATAREDQSEQQKQQKLADARSLLAAQSFREALALLNALTVAHPKDGAVTKLRALVQREQEKQAKDQQLQRELDVLKKLMADKKYLDVIARAQELLAEFPSDTNILRLSEFATSRQADVERESLFRKKFDEAKGLFDAGRFEDATRTLQNALKTFPGNPEFQSLYQQAEVQQKKQQVRQQIEHRIREIRVKINREELSEAVDLAQQTLMTLGPDTDLTHLLNSAQVELQARERKRQQETVLETIRTMIDSGDLDGASRTIDEVVESQALDSFDPRIQRLAARITEAKTAAEAGPPVAPAIPPGLSKEYAFLQGTPLPDAPPAIEKVPPADAMASTPLSASTTALPQHAPTEQPIEPPVAPKPETKAQVAKTPTEEIATGRRAPEAPTVRIPAPPTPLPSRPVVPEPTPAVAPIPDTVARSSVPLWRKPAVLAVAALVVISGVWLGLRSGNEKAPTPTTKKSGPTRPALPRVDPLEVQQRQAIDAANTKIAANDLDGAAQVLQPAAALNGPLTPEIQKKLAQIEESKNDANLRQLRQNEEVLWQRATKLVADGRYTEAQKSLKQILALPTGGVHRDDAQQYLTKTIPQQQAQKSFLAQGHQRLAQGDFASARRAAEQLRQAGGNADQLSAQIDQGELAQLKQLEGQFDQLKTRDDESATQSLKALQPKFQALADGGPQSGEAQSYADNVSSAIADVHTRAEKKAADAAFQQMVQRYRQAAASNDKNALVAARGELQSVAQGGGPHADSAQQYLSEVNKKLDALNAPPPPPPPVVKETAPVVPVVPDETFIRGVVQKFFQAFEQRSPEALRQAWPTIPQKRYDAYRNAFGNVSAITIQVTGESIKVSPDGTSATVSVQSDEEETPKSDNRARKFSPSWTFQLSKKNGNWQISDVL